MALGSKPRLITKKEENVRRVVHSCQERRRDDAQSYSALPGRKKQTIG